MSAAGVYESEEAKKVKKHYILKLVDGKHIPFFVSDDDLAKASEDPNYIKQLAIAAIQQYASKKQTGPALPLLTTSSATSVPSPQPSIPRPPETRPQPAMSPPQTMSSPWSLSPPPFSPNLDDLPPSESSPNNSQHETWTRNAILALFDCYKSEKDRFDDGKTRSATIWDDISKALMAEGYSFTGSQAWQKWRNLKKKYSEIKRHNDKSGNNYKHFDYVNEMDALLSKDHNINPLVVVSSSGYLKVSDQARSLNELQGPSTSPRSEQGENQRPERNDFQTQDKRRGGKRNACEEREQSHKEKMSKIDTLLSQNNQLIEIMRRNQEIELEKLELLKQSHSK